MSARRSARRTSAFVEQIAHERIGQVLRGRWTLERVLGMGGMAAVYQARHRNGALVAVKMLHPALSASATLCERFVREGYVANRVAHPRVPRVLDDDAEGGNESSAFLVMELIEGITLEERTGPCRPGDAEILRVARDVLEILVAAHGKGVIHRDLKPDNLMIDKDGRVHVLDFGIARLLDSDEGSIATTTGAAFGTPAFLSPEQALGRRDLIGPATDIYGLGATLFTLASDEFVHSSQQAQELVLFAATRRARSIAACAPQLGRGVIALIDRATQYDPRERFLTAAEMLREVERLLAERADAERPSSSQNVPAVAMTPVRRVARRGGSIAIGAFGLAMVSAIGFAFHLGETRRAAADDTHFANARLTPALRPTTIAEPISAKGIEAVAGPAAECSAHVRGEDLAADTSPGVAVVVGTPVAMPAPPAHAAFPTPTRASDRGVAPASRAAAPAKAIAKKPVDLGY